MKINSTDEDLVNEAIEAIMTSHPDYENLFNDEGWEWNSAIDTILQGLLATRDKAWRSTIKKAQFGLVTVWFRLLVYHYATFASKAKGLMPPRYEWRLRAL